MDTIIPRTKDDLEAAAALFQTSDAVACDTETTGLKAGVSKLLSIQFSDGHNHVLIPSSEGVSGDAFRRIFEDPAKFVIFHNARFDLPFLREEGFLVKNVYDTMLAEKVLTRGGDQSVSLAETLYRYFAVDLDKEQRKKFGNSWDGNWTDELVEYAMKDVAYLPELMRQQIEWMEKLGEKDRYDESIAKMLANVAPDS